MEGRVMVEERGGVEEAGVEEAALDALVGRWAMLRPADGQPVVVEGGARGARPGVGSTGSAGPPGGGQVVSLAGVVLADDAVEAAVMALEGGVLRCETRDRRAAGLDERPVLVEFGTPAAMLQVPATARVLVSWPLPVVLALTPSGPVEQYQRRAWVRVPVAVPVEVAATVEGEGGEEAARVATVSRDLSAGGCRLELVPGLERLGPGDERRVVLGLPDQPLVLAARVVGRGERDRTLRLEFLAPPEAAVKRLLRFVFDVQLRQRRGQDP
jgi:hypothetical protein